MTCCVTLIGDYWQGDARQKYFNGQVVTIIALVGALFFVLYGATPWRCFVYLYLLPMLLVPNAVARLLKQLPPSRRAKGIGIFTSCFYLGQFASPLLVAFLAGSSQDIPSGIDNCALALLALAACWIAAAMHDRRHVVLTH